MATIALSKPKQQNVSPELMPGDSAPDTNELWEGGDSSSRMSYISFLRHVGCPFAEATVVYLRQAACEHTDISFIVVTHGDKLTTQTWFEEIGGVEGLRWVHDAEREIYGRWGIGYSGLSHILSPKNFKDIIALRKVGIKNRDASGTRWQLSATFLVQNDKVVWKSIPDTANQIPVIESALEVLDQ